MRIVSEDGKRETSSSQCSVRKVQERGPRSRFVPANATTKGAFWERMSSPSVAASVRSISAGSRKSGSAIR